MTLFSRCESPQHLAPAANSSASRRTRIKSQGSGLSAVFADFVEEIGILFRYAAGLDYYGRDGHEKGR